MVEELKELVEADCKISSLVDIGGRLHIPPLGDADSTAPTLMATQDIDTVVIIANKLSTIKTGVQFIPTSMLSNG